MKMVRSWIPVLAALVVTAAALASCAAPSGNEGTLAAPVDLGSAVAAAASHAGTVDVQGSSYYKATVTSGGAYTVTVTAMTYDADLVVYSDSSFSVEYGTSKNYGTTDESVSVSSAPGSTLYVKVSGADSTHGVFFTVTVK